MNRLATALANFTCQGSIWLVSDIGRLKRLSLDQYAALPLASPLLGWSARLDEDEAIKMAEKRRGRVN